MQRVKIEGLVIAEDRIELAFQDDAYIYVCRLTERPGAPKDPTKLVFDVRVWLWNDANGDGVFNGDSELGTRVITNGIIVFYNDPAVGDVSEPIEVRLVETVKFHLTTQARPWADSVTKVPQLHVLLADPELPNATMN